MNELPSESTCWELVRDAAAGDSRARELFAQRYEPVVRRYLGHRWSARRLGDHVDDAVQEVFVELFRGRGALERLDAGRSGGFRPFFYGVVRNVARRFEAGEARRGADVTPSVAWPEGPAADDPTLSLVFDRAWLDAVLRQAVELLEERAGDDDEARRRLAILRQRFGEDRRYRDVARELGVDEAEIYREATRARNEFKGALLEVIARDHPGPAGAIERECRELLERLGG